MQYIKKIVLLHLIYDYYRVTLHALRKYSNSTGLIVCQSYDSKVQCGRVTMTISRLRATLDTGAVAIVAYSRDSRQMQQVQQVQQSIVGAVYNTVGTVVNVGAVFTRQKEQLYQVEQCIHYTLYSRSSPAGAGYSHWWLYSVQYTPFLAALHRYYCFLQLQRLSDVGPFILVTVRILVKSIYMTIHCKIKPLKVKLLK